MMNQLFFLFTLVSLTLWGQDSLPDIPDMLPPQAMEEQGGKFMGEFIKVMVAVGIMIAALLFLSWSTRKMMRVKIQQGNESSSLKVLETRMISQKTTLYQLEFEGRSILIAESLNGVTLLETSDLDAASNPN